MEIIPQEKEADISDLCSKLRSSIEFLGSDVRVFVFGSWASYKKSFTEGDVDVFVGTRGYEYNESDKLAELREKRLNVLTTDGELYKNRRIELHWGNVTDFLEETEDWERVELTEYMSL